MKKLKLAKVVPAGGLNDSVITDLKPKVSQSVYKNGEIKEYNKNMEKIGRIYKIENGVVVNDSIEKFEVLNVTRTLNRAN
jgi:hypothetical protein